MYLHNLEEHAFILKHENASQFADSYTIMALRNWTKLIIHGKEINDTSINEKGVKKKKVGVQKTVTASQKNKEN